MEKQLTIQDMDTFIDALKYSQTLVNTANSGADLSFDFLRSYDYYGAVSMATSSVTSLSANAIALSGYAPSDFYQYSDKEMKDYFYGTDELIDDMVSISSIGAVDNNSFLTRDIINYYSIISEGEISADKLQYDGSLSFDIENDSSNTIFPISAYDTIYLKMGNAVNIDSKDWDVNIHLKKGHIKKVADSASFSMNGVSIHGGVSSKNIEFSSKAESRDEVLKNVIKEDGVISSNAVIPSDIQNSTNIFTLSKFNSTKYKKFGDEIELHLTKLYTDAELKKKVDDYMEISGSDLIYGGEDTFLTKEQSEMITEYIFRKVTSITKSNLQL